MTPLMFFGVGMTMANVSLRKKVPGKGEGSLRASVFYENLALLLHDHSRVGLVKIFAALAVQGGGGIMRSASLIRMTLHANICVRQVVRCTIRFHLSKMCCELY